MVIESSYISGESISLTDDLFLLSANNFYSSDLFLISQQCLSNVSPDRTYTYNGITLETEYRSLNETYQQLSDQVLKDISSCLGFKSMAWEDERWYSLVDHIHNYSRMSVSANPEVALLKDKTNKDELSTICMTTIDTAKTTLYMPKIHMYDMPKPYIGQLKFLALPILKDIPNTDDFYNSKEFDGWIYPDGRSLSKTRFNEAFEVFGTSYGSIDDNTFNVPNLNNFIKTTLPNNTSNFSNIINYLTNISAHSHVISDMKIDGNVSVDLSVRLTESSGGTPAIHDSHGEWVFIDGALIFKVDKMNCLTSQITTSLAENDVETYPTYNLLPVLMYIGGEK